MLERRNEVGLVRDRALVLLLDVAEAHHARRHPVGEHREVAADVLPLRELGLELAEPLLVVVDLLDVFHLHSALGGELVEGRPLVPLLGVDVEGPVRKDERVRELLLDLGRGPTRAGLPRDAAASTAGRNQGREAERARADCCALQKQTSGDRVIQPGVGHSLLSFSDSTTNVDSGLHERVTWSPGWTAAAPASLFWT